MTSDESLSDRGKKILQHTSRADMELFFEANENLYSEKNQDGAFPLCVAENRLCWDMLKQKIESITHQNEIPTWVPSYTSPLGSPLFRETVSNFMATFLTKCPVNSDHLGCSAGAASVIEVTTAVLADTGDVAVFPAPAYPVYREDIHSMAGMERYDLQTHQKLKELNDGPVLRIDHLEKARNDLESRGKRFRLLVITHPDNPTGMIYHQDQLKEMAEWCVAHKIHMVVNEIYGLSIHVSTSTEMEDSFRSFAQIMQEMNSDYLHMWYAFSKDFGISGLRLGLVYSLNESFLQAYSRNSIGHMTSNYTQWVVGEVLKDHDFIRQYIDLNQRLLSNCYQMVISVLSQLNLAYVPARGGLFIWVDLSPYLLTQSREAEHEFWLALYRETGILLTPGDGFGHQGYGRFRMIYSFLSQPYLEKAMEKLKRYLRGIKRVHL